MLEKPSYLGAIQAFSQYRPNFYQVDLNDDGINTDLLEKTLNENSVKLMYMVPNFQNPTGLTYTQEIRNKVFEILV